MIPQPNLCIHPGEEFLDILFVEGALPNRHSAFAQVLLALGSNQRYGICQTIKLSSDNPLQTRPHTGHTLNGEAWHKRQHGGAAGTVSPTARLKHIWIYPNGIQNPDPVLEVTSLNRERW